MISDSLLFPAPEPTYAPHDLAGYLCWIPWDGAPQAAASASQSFAAGGGTSGLLPCLWLPAAASSTVVLYCHANAEDLGGILRDMHRLQQDLQVSVLAVEYPGYGGLKAMPPSEEGTYMAAVAGLLYLTQEMGVDPKSVTVVGRSMGGAPASFVASRYPVGGLILVNTFCSVQAVAEGFVGQSLARLLAPDIFNNESTLPAVRCPVLLIHGNADRVIDPGHSLRLYECCRAQKMLVHPDQMGHNTNMFDSPSYFTLHTVRFFDLPRKGSPPVMPRTAFAQPVAPSVCCDLAGLGLAQDEEMPPLCPEGRVPVEEPKMRIVEYAPSAAMLSGGRVSINDAGLPNLLQPSTVRLRREPC